MKVVIMAGGKGTRISKVANDVPKVMIKIDGKPVLEYGLKCLKVQGYTDILITIGHLGHVIKNYFGNGSRFGIKIEYYEEKKLLGNAGALYNLKDKLTKEFFLINGDVIFDINFNKMFSFHKKMGAKATVLVHPNNHPYDSGIIITDNEHRILQWLTKENEKPLYYKNQVNAGIHIISSELLNIRPDTEKVDLDRQILKPLCGTGRLYAYHSSEYVKDMGTPERLAQVEEDIESGKVSARNLMKKQRAIFLDRDGTINKYRDFLCDINEFELISGVAQQIREINQSGYLVIVVTNQPVIARGEVTVEQLEEIHNKMETLLGREGAYIDAIYYCPHHPDKGFDGELPEFKKICDCRKPATGMFLKAAKDFNIDLHQSWMIGDSLTDMEAGKNAGCKCMLVDRDRGWEISKKI